MESRVISQHQVLIVAFAVSAPGNGWFTTRAAADKMRIPPRTVRHHLRRLVELGVLERVRVFGGCRYHVRAEVDMDERAMDYLRRLSEVRKTFERKPGRLRTTLASFAGMRAI
jgi:predicted transcriptional regulator